MPLRKRKFTGKKRAYTRKRAYGRVSSKVGFSMRRKYARKTAYRRRRTYKRKSSGYSSFKSDPRSKMFPQRKYATLVYQNEGFALNPGSGKTTDVFLWNCANIRDCNRTSTGHQPMYYDDMMRLYQYYTVMEAKIICEFASGVGGDTNSYHIGVAVRPDIATSNKAHIYAENGGCKSTIFNYTHGVKQLSLTYYPGKTLGFDGSPLDQASLLGNDYADPTALPTFQVFCNAMTTTSTPGSVFCSVKLQYKCCFTEPLYQAPNLDKPDTYPAGNNPSDEDGEMVDSKQEEKMVSVPASMMARMGLV